MLGWGFCVDESRGAFIREKKEESGYNEETKDNKSVFVKEDIFMKLWKGW